MQRRVFLTAAGLTATAGCSRLDWDRAKLRALEPAEARVLEAWVDALIPADDDPGATEAGVVEFIDRQLARRYRKHRERYRQAAALVEKMAREAHGRGFAELDLEARTRLLEKLEGGEGKALFEMVLAHAMQGFYGNPRHGGNREYASWRMMGVPSMPVRGRA